MICDACQMGRHDMCVSINCTCKHKPKIPEFHITTDEMLALEKWLCTQYIPYDNEPLQSAVNKIVVAVREYELAQKSSSPT